jgi:3-hydroxyacyl-CoA dehydrogenase
MSHRIETVTILGLGTLGAQIALQSAVSGYRVRAYDPDENSLRRFLKTLVDSDRMTVKPNPVDLTKWQGAAGQAALSGRSHHLTFISVFAFDIWKVCRANHESTHRAPSTM